MEYFARNFLGYTIVFRGGEVSILPGETIFVETKDVEDGLFDQSIARGEIEVYRALAPINSNLSLGSVESGGEFVMPDISELIDDEVARVLVPGPNTQIVYDDPGNKIHIDASAPQVFDLGSGAEFYLTPIANNVIYRINASEDITINMSTVSNPAPSPFLPPGYTPVDGLGLLIHIQQTAGGNHAVEFTGVSFNDDLTEFVPSTANFKTDIVGLIYSAPRDTWDIMAMARGYRMMF